MAVLAIALLLLIVSTQRNTGFFANLDVIHQAKYAAIYFSEVRLLLTSLVYFRNSPYYNDMSTNNFPSFIEEALQSSRN